MEKGPACEEIKEVCLIGAEINPEISIFCLFFFFLAFFGKEQHSPVGSHSKRGCLNMVIFSNCSDM